MCPRESNRLMGVQDEGKVVAFPGFSKDTTQAYSHAGGKDCLRRTALSTFVVNVIARSVGVSGPCSEYRSGPKH
jgi:hypothetical protein